MKKKTKKDVKEQPIIPKNPGAPKFGPPTQVFGQKNIGPNTSPTTVFNPGKFKIQHKG